MKTVILIGCTKRKRSHPCEAKLLYDKSSLFRKSLAYAQKTGNDTYVVSAKYGLVGLEEIIEPYDDTLNDRTDNELDIWGKMTVEQTRLGSLSKYMQTKALPEQAQ